MFSEKDLLQIETRGLNLDKIQNQIQRFKDGYPYLQIIRPALREDGIKYIKNEETLINYFETHIQDLKQIRFVPASGAASRMFKALFEFINHPDELEKYPEVEQVIGEIDKLALKPDLQRLLAGFGSSVDVLVQNKEYREVLNFILDRSGLNYGNLPKALLKFHCYPFHNRTALEEHLVEAALYNKNREGEVHIHFTISPEHEKGFRELLQEVQDDYEQKFQVRYYISFSYQKPSTDTIAVDLDNAPFRIPNGELLFRPGGHGALLENLNDLDADIIFIKNIDNVAPDRSKSFTVRYKKLIGGLLLTIQEQIFSYLERLERSEPDQKLLNEIEHFLVQELCVSNPDMEQWDPSAKRSFFMSKLNRPIRVCGMVPNEGEPGGGPYFAKSKDGSIALQIAESSQVDLNDKNTKKLFSQATHFNPVDLVCAVKDYKGKKFDLRVYRDDETGFISTKSSEGRDLKALEWPGLWNGAMSDWNTLFVEVPIETFTPVKSINDLLRPEHL